MKSRIGQISLFIAVVGLIITEAGIHTGVLRGQFWRILATGFEAGTIGGLADWFAVSALFQKIPIPIISRHTNIIVKNRLKLTEAIVELVTTKWLSANIIHQKLKGVGIAKGIFTLLEKPKNLVLVTGFVRHPLLQMLRNSDNPRLVILVKDILKEQVDNADIATPLGAWLEKIVQNRDHHPIVDRLLRESTQALDDTSTRTMIQEKLKAVMEAYEKQGILKKAAVKIGKWTGGIDIDLLTDRLLNMAREIADEAESNPRHALRQKLDQSLMDVARDLREGDPATLAFIDNIKRKVMEDRELKSMFMTALSRIKSAVEEQLSDNDTDFMRFIRTRAAGLIKKYGADDAFLLKMDDWMKETIAQLVNRYHHEVGNMVRESLLKLDDQELVWQIKEKVGDDLQYIRLNGALVGGLVGIVIALIRMFVLY